MIRILEGTHCPYPLIASRIVGKTRMKQAVSTACVVRYNWRRRGSFGSLEQELFSAKTVQQYGVFRHHQGNVTFLKILLSNILGPKYSLDHHKNQESRVTFREWEEAEEKTHFHWGLYHSINFPGGHSSVVISLLHKQHTIHHYTH